MRAFASIINLKIIGVISIGLGMVLPTPIFAQNFERLHHLDNQQQLDMRVSQRFPRDFVPEGLQYKGFVIRPELEIETKYSTNIRAEHQDEKSDIIALLRPALRVTKNIGRHQFLAGFRSEIRKFKNYSAENIADFNAYMHGRLEVTRQWKIPFSFLHNKQARAREASQTAQTSSEPLDIEYSTARLGLIRQFNRLSLGLHGERTAIRNEDGSTSSGAPVIFRDSDRNRTMARLRLQYDIPRGTHATEKNQEREHIFFTDLIYAQNKYLRGQFVNGSYSGIKGDHDEYGLRIGFDTEYKGLLFGHAAIGYTQRRFEDNTLEDTGTFNIEADLSYNILPKLTLNLNADRRTSQDNGFVQGVVETGITIGADYELLHDWYLGGSLGYENHNFTSGTRDDDDVSIGMNLRHYLSQNLSANLGVDYISRDSTVTNENFDRTQLLFSIKGAL